MRRVLIVSVLVVMATGIVAASQQPIAVERGKAVLELIRAGRFEDVTKQFNAQMTAGLSAAQLRQMWANLSQQVGALESIVDERVATPAPGITAAVLGCQFEKAALNVIVAFDAENKIGGLQIVPRPSAAQASAVPPASSRFKEEAVTVGTGEWALPGTLSLPSGPISAAVVLVHGSGPNDRDETVGPNKPFRDIAWGLAERGIAVLRYEKRTRQHGATLASSGRQHYTVRDETTEDALLAVTLLRSRREIDPKRIFVLGHSLGGTLAPRIAAEDQSLAGIIVLAGATRPLPEVVKDQLTYLSSLQPGSINPEAELQSLLKSAPESYWKDLAAYKPAEVAATLRIPMLILHGERDYQVTQPDLEGWRNALGTRDDVVIKSYPTLNHLFMAGERKATPAEYNRPAKVAEFVIDDIASWIASSVRD